MTHDSKPPERLTYSGSGVDIERGDEAVRRIKGLVDSVARPEVASDLGGFAGLFQASFPGRDRPLLSAATDSVGTKVMIAFQLGKHDTVGIDCVAMCVNDIVVGGAEPLFFLDYIGIHRAEPDLVATIVSGVAEGCRRANCALLGGETAEMPGLYRPGEYDLVGFSVGVVSQEAVIDGSRARAGDKLIGLSSSGVHSNGFSLLRQALLERGGYSLDTDPGGVLGRSLGEELLEPTRIYVRPALKVLESFPVKAMAHITGGGIPGNVPRVLHEHLEARIDWGSWPVHPVFDLVQKVGNIAEDEMRRTFNMGIGLIMVVDPVDASSVMEALSGLDETPYIIGEVVGK